MKTLLKNLKYIKCGDAGDVFCDEGNILIEDKMISYIGKEEPESDICEDLRGCLAVPGLINAHTHLGMSIMRNLADDMVLSSWLNDAVWPFEDKMSADDIYWSSKLSLAEMVSTGTTTVSDMYFEMDRVAECVDESGMRAVLARGLVDILSEKEGLERLEFAKYLYRAYSDKADGRIRFMLGPHAIYTCSTDYLKEILKTAKQLSIGIHIHVAESESEVENCIKDHGMRPVEYLQSLGFSDHHILAAHCVHLNEKEIQSLDVKKFFPVHCPSSNLKLSSGIAPVSKMIERGLYVSLGTDSAVSNNNLDMILEARTASLLAKGITMDPTALNAKQVFKMMTINGARALGIDHIAGTLEKGKRADIAIFNVDTVNTCPGNNLISALVHSVRGSDCKRTYVDGKLLYKDGEYLTIDIEKTKYEVTRRNGNIRGEVHDN